MIKKMSKIINESIFIKTLKPNINTIKIKKKFTNY